MKKPHIVMIDNYDSFTFNLVQYFQELGASVQTIRNDWGPATKAVQLPADLFVISPGPSNPDHAGLCLDLVSLCIEKNLPLFGVCLGHQCIGQALGGNVIRAEKAVHGKVSQLKHTGHGAFKGLPSPVSATRYHSLIVDHKTLPNELEVTASTEDGTIMGFRHKSKPIEGVQFHPESILTETGKQMLQNVIDNALAWTP